MSEYTRRLITATMVAVVAGFLFFLAVSAFQFPVRTVLVRFQWPWILRNAVANLIDSLPALQITAVLVTFSLLINVVELRATHGELPSFFSLVNGPLVFLLVMTAVYTVLILAVEPRVISGRDELAARTEMARRFRSSAEAHRSDGEYNLAVIEFRHYLAVNPDDLEAESALRDAVALAERESEDQREAEDRPARPITARRNLDAVKSVQRAQEYLEEENYITALYYARLARELDPERDDADRIIGLALDRLATDTPSRAEEEERWLFLQKREGYQLYEQGRYLDAYYLFRDLAERYPGDTDVQLYLQKVRDRLEEQAFFLGEILPIVALSGGTRLTFRNSPDHAGSEYVRIDKVVQATTGTYAIGIEALGLDENGAVRYHLEAPYGKLRDGTLNMHAVSETERSESVSPTYLAGSRPSELQHLLALSLPTSDLMTIAKANESIRSVRLTELLAMVSLLDSHGYGLARTRAELLRRVMEPFSFIVLALLAIALSWQLRSRYVSRPPIVALALVPAFPFVVYYGFVCYRYALQVLSTHALLHIGMVGSIGVSVVLQSVLLAVALLLVATRMAE